MSNNIQIPRLPALVRKMEQLGKLDAVKHGMKAGALHVKGKIAKYPPSSEANTPNQRFWYQRGYGPKWKRRDGSVGGKKTSETLGKKWTIASRDNDLTWVVGNNVSYGIYVQSAKHQAKFHAKRGWKTTETVAEQEADKVVKFIAKEVARALKEPA